MQKWLETKGENVILRYTAFFVNLFQQILVYMWPAWSSYLGKHKILWFSLEGDFNAIVDNRIICKITTNFVKSS